jgi:hypothetical protein
MREREVSVSIVEEEPPFEDKRQLRLGQLWCVGPRDVPVGSVLLISTPHSCRSTARLLPRDFVQVDNNT